MPSAYPFPSIAALSLSTMITVKRVSKLPTVREVFPWEHARINDSYAGIYGAHVDGYEGI